ncbi:MAG TPA: class I SAM-dependent methyltransferase [Vicinamibacterales bacterium]|nr:class I SAM-dependent methyltransferase [Vicinamibacterales bacterium]
MTATQADWALSLYRRSVLKQAKVREITSALGDVGGRRCLDLGGDNGIVSYLLREGGGAWVSADVGERNTGSIRALVGRSVCRIDGVHLPFRTRSFDAIVVVDLLEHVADDRGLAAELARIIRPGGLLIVNVPHLKPRSILNRLRHAAGLTDAWHGHVRPGYSAAGLRRLLSPGFRIDRSRTYSRAFTETIDLALNAAYLRRAPSSDASKGTVVTGEDMASQPRGFALLSAAFPLLRVFSALDALLPLQPGYKLIVRAIREGGTGRDA